MALSADILASVADDRIRALWWIEIEGLRVRYGTATPSWTPADSGTNRPVKPWLKVPQVGGQKAEPLNGDTKGHTIAAEILDVGDALTDLFAIHNRSAMAVTTLTDDIAAGGVTLTVADSSVFSLPCDIYLDRETMRATAAPTGTTLTVTRGMYGSADVAHTKNHPASTIDREAEVTDAPQFIHTRRLTLKEGRVNLLEADAFTFHGFIDGIEERDGLWSLSASGNITRLKAKIGENRAKSYLLDQITGEYFSTPQPSGSAEMLAAWNDPSSQWYRMRGYSLFLPGSAEGLFPAASSTQRRLVKVDDELIAYEYRDGASSALTLYDGWLAAQDYGPDSWQLVPTNRGIFCAEIFPFDQDWSNHERSPSGRTRGTGLYNNILIAPHMAQAEVVHCLWHEDFTAGTDPVSVTLQLLLSGNGTGGTYDTLPDGWGLGLPEADVDIESMEDVKSLVSDIALKFAIVEPVECGKWLKENVWRPCMLFPVEQLDGKISLRRLYTRSEAIARGSSVTIDHSKMLAGSTPRMPMGGAPIGELKVKFNWEPGVDEFWAEAIVTFGETKTRYTGASQTVEIECKSLYAPGALGQVTGAAWDLGSLPQMLGGLVGTIFDRFALQPLPTFEVEVPYNLWPSVQVGNVVRLTSTVLPNVKTGRRGITGEWCQVIEVKPNTRKSSLNIKLAYVGVHDAETRRIAPSAKVKSYTADVGAPARTKIEIYRNTFTNSAGSRDDVDEFAAGDFVRFYNSECEPKDAAAESALEIDEIDTSGATYDIVWLVAAELDYPPVDGDYMEIADYDQQVSTQQDKFASQADANSTLGATPDNGHVRE